MKLISLIQIIIVIYTFSVGLEHVDVLGSGGTFTLAKLTGLLLAFAYCCNLVVNQPKVITKQTVVDVWPLLLYALILILQNLLNFDTYSKTLIDTAFLLNLFVLIVILNFMKKDFRLIDRSLTAFSIGAVITCIILVLGVGVEINADGRHTIFAANHNELAFKFAIAFSILVFNFEKPGTKRFKRLAILCCLIGLAYGTVLTGSRSAILVILFVSCLFSLVNESIPRLIRISGVALVVSLVVFQVLNSAELSARFDLFGFETSGTNDVVGGRLLIWSVVIGIMQDSLMFGVGRSGYEHLVYLAVGQILNPHNVILECILYTGVLGTSIVLLFFKRLGSNAIQHYIITRDTCSLYLLPSLILMVIAQQIFAIKVFWLISAVILARCQKNSWGHRG